MLNASKNLVAQLDAVIAAELMWLPISLSRPNAVGQFASYTCTVPTHLFRHGDIHGHSDNS